MFKEMKKLLNYHFEKMQTFNKENEINKLNIAEKNDSFSKVLNNKIASSESRISELRKSIQNTKL
ncbi:UNVERIFIED_ORG: hypothetical protein B2H98_05190 [Clostridium botulinum]|uniref:hypothetical protein n=1 Tax=Clostridium TaxID=1485 RepID=UPI000540AAE4|nr:MULTISPECIES: hypothetical protein [Clostridium]AIY79431.1 hypothetical protein U728_1060 [Clostridium botulinum 202F]KAI3345958.1 hypothetical protein CIT17_10260 [Clostridium botulinum]KON13471.1 hypothetical protein ACP50_05210 [Clostridium botulinum]MBN1059322.1 hypothetical protein [Clostridium botulinum]MBY6987841.1 hypothetical protein [Clostridium botulinum]